MGPWGRQAGSPQSKPTPPSPREGSEASPSSRSAGWERKEGWTWSTSSASYQLCVAKSVHTGRPTLPCPFHGVIVRIKTENV